MTSFIGILGQSWNSEISAILPYEIWFFSEFQLWPKLLLNLVIFPLQGPQTQIDAFQTNIFSWFNDILIKTQWFLGSWVREIWHKTFIFLFHQPQMASKASERKFIKNFKGGRRGPLIIVPRPCPSGSKKLSIGAFIWGIFYFCASIGSFRIWKKAGEWRLKSLFLFLLLQKSERKLTEFFRYLRIVITKLWIYLNWMFYIKFPYLRIP